MLQLYLGCSPYHVYIVFVFFIFSGNISLEMGVRQCHIDCVQILKNLSLRPMDVHLLCEHMKIWRFSIRLWPCLRALNGIVTSTTKVIISYNIYIYIYILYNKPGIIVRGYDLRILRVHLWVTPKDPRNHHSFHHWTWLALHDWGHLILGNLHIHTHWLKNYKYTPLNLNFCCFEALYCNKHGCETFVIRQLNNSELGNHLKLSIFGSSGRFSSPFRQGQFGEPPASRQVASSGDDILMVLKGVDNPLDPLVHHDFLDLTYMQYICTWIIMDYSTWLMCWTNNLGLPSGELT